MSRVTPSGSYPAYAPGRVRPLACPARLPQFGQKVEEFDPGETVSGLKEINLHKTLDVLRSLIHFIPIPTARETTLKLVDRLEDALFRDRLSGIYNRTQFDYMSANSFHEFKKHPKAGPLGLIMLDLDGFKQLNDTYGHEAGDRAIHQVAQQMQRIVADFEDKGNVCRIGGDEFAIVLPETSMDSIKASSEKIREQVGHLSIDGVDPEKAPLGISQGVALLAHGHSPQTADKPIESLRQFKQQADKLLYAAKDRKARGEQSPVETAVYRLG